MIPAFRSASIESCLPGNASNVNLRRDFRNTNRAVVDHDVLDHDQNQKDDDSDRVVSADHKLSECLDDVARGAHSLIAVEKNQTG